MSLRRPWPVRSVFAGQSLLLDNPVLDAITVPELVALEGGWAFANIAIDGLGYADLLHPAFRPRLTTQARNLGEGFTDVLVMALSGQGDLANTFGSTPTAQDAYDAWVEYAELGRTAGFDLVVATTMPPLADEWLDFYGFDPVSEGEAKRQAINALVLADAEGAFDVVVDVEDVAPQPPDGGDAIFADGIHLSEAGRRLYAPHITSGIRQALAA